MAVEPTNEESLAHVNVWVHDHDEALAVDAVKLAKELRYQTNA